MSRLRTLLFLIACLSLARASAQHATSDFWEDPLGSGEAAMSAPILEPDEGLFERPLDIYGIDPFTRLSEFNFSATRYERRGYDYTWERLHLHGLDLSDAVSGRLDYNLTTALRYAPGGREGTFLPSKSPVGGRLSLLASDRAGRLGFRAAAAGKLGERWLYGVSGGRRWGRDAQVQGVFLDQTTFSAALERRFGDRSSLTLFIADAPTERSSRTAATAETFALTGERLYNPSWGWFDGRQRSSRVRRSDMPFGALVFNGDWGRRQLEVALAYRSGSNSYSGLTWYDAQSPLPDYYRYLPSFIAEPTASEQTAAYWRARDPKVTQIDWQELGYQNLMADGQAIYVVSEQVEEPESWQFVARLSSRPERAVKTQYGIRARIDRTSNYERLSDLMGAGWIVDVDQFLVDDEFYGNQAQNDLRHPDRRVAAGERFGYHYEMRRDYAALFGAIDYRAGGWHVGAQAEGGNVSLQRNGLYEKELYPGSKSFGTSEKATFFDYNIRLEAGYALGAHHFFDASARFESRAPLAANLFLTQRYSNAMVDNPCAWAVYGGELSYRFVGEALQLWLSGFYTLTADQTEVRHYYDDLSEEYGDLVISELSKRYADIELGAQWVFSPRLALQLAAATGAYTYAADPRMDLFADADGGRIYVGERAPLQGFRLGTSPQTVASGELRYSGTHGWMASLSISYMADHYISPDPTRRMQRATAYATSPESFAAMTAQERFPAAVTLGAFVWKRFRVADNEFVLTLSVDNLLDNRQIVYSGYEPMRLRRAGTGIDRTFAPHDSKYLYNRGRTWYTSLTYRF